MSRPVIPPRKIYTPRNWYWTVGDGEPGRFWSSAEGSYVDSVPEGAGLTVIDTEASLRDVLAAYGLPGPGG